VAGFFSAVLLNKIETWRPQPDIGWATLFSTRTSEQPQGPGFDSGSFSFAHPNPTMTQTPRKLIACIVASAAVSPVLAQGPAIPTQDVVTVEHALAAGKQLNATIDLTRCTGDTPNTPAGTTRGGLTVSAYRILPDNTLSFADTHFTVRSDGTPITQFLRYTIDTTGTARFASYIFAMPAYTLQSQVSYTCKLGDGVKLFVQY